MDALLIFGMQYDFLPPGNAAIPGAEDCAIAIQSILRQWPIRIVINDHHPPDHLSFAACHPWRKPYQHIQTLEGPLMLWPMHAVQGTLGSLNPSWLIEGPHHLFLKGEEKLKDNPDALLSRDKDTGKILRILLQEKQVNHLFLSGLPLYPDLRETALAGLKAGFRVSLIRECILPLPDTETEVEFFLLEKAGAQIVELSQVKS